MTLHDDEVLVSVVMITYNHENYVAEALQGALNQTVIDNLEVVVGDDASTDSTPQVIREYAARFPDALRPILRSENLGPPDRRLAGRRNFMETYALCRGKYVAILEGDDYWTDHKKLERQIALLEQRPNAALVCHTMRVKYSDERVDRWGESYGRTTSPAVGVRDVLDYGSQQLPTSSMLFRHDALPAIPAWFDEVYNADFVLQALLAESGDVIFINDPMAVHRKHQAGQSQLYDEDPDYCNDMLLKLFHLLDDHFDHRYHDVIRRTLALIWRAKANRRMSQGQYVRAVTALAKQLWLTPARERGRAIRTWRDELRLRSAPVRAEGEIDDG